MFAKKRGNRINLLFFSVKLYFYGVHGFYSLRHFSVYSYCCVKYTHIVVLQEH